VRIQGWSPPASESVRPDIHLLFGYVAGVSLASAAIPLGAWYVKFDWLAANLLCIASFGMISRGMRINSLVSLYVLVFASWLVANGLIASLTSNSPFHTTGFVSYFLQFQLALITFLMISSMRLDAFDIRKILNFWTMVACGACVLAVAQVLTGDRIVGSLLYIPYYADTTLSQRVVAGLLAPTGWFAEASWLGSFLVVPTAFVLIEAAARRSSRLSLPYLAAALILIAGLFLSYPLTATISVVVGRA